MSTRTLDALAERFPAPPSAAAFRAQANKSIALIGMSGVGKTTIANRLRTGGDWFHYSVDYRIGTRYMGEAIVDNVKREAMKVPFLRDLLRSDSIYIASNITFENLAPLSTYLGKPGDPKKSGLPFDDYLDRQRQHRAAEIAALLDVGPFVDKARAIYGYDHFVCDCGGSLVEVVDPWDPNDTVMTALARRTVLVSLRGEPGDQEELTRRFIADPKPMYYQEAFLVEKWREYREEKGVAPDEVDPDDFIRWGYRQLITHRAPRYHAIGENWGVEIPVSAFSSARSADDVVDVVAEALAAKHG